MNNENTMDPTSFEASEAATAKEETRKEEIKQETTAKVDKELSEESFSRARLTIGAITEAIGTTTWKIFETGVFFMTFYIVWAMTMWPLWAVFLLLVGIAAVFHYIANGLQTGNWNPISQIGF